MKGLLKVIDPIILINLSLLHIRGKKENNLKRDLEPTCSTKRALGHEFFML